MGALLAAAGGVAAGTALGLGRGRLAWPLTIGASAALVATGVVRKDRLAALIAVVIALSCGAGASAAWRSVGVDEAMLPKLARRHVLAEACGVVRLRRPRSIEIQATALVVGRVRWRTNEPLRVGGRNARSIFPGHRICARGPVSPPRPGRREAPLLSARTLRPAGEGSAMRAAAARVRGEFSSAARAALPPTQAGLLLGMTDGDTEFIDEVTNEDFRATGLAHLVAVSGYNVAVFLALVMIGARALAPRSRWLRVALALPALVFFVFLTGLEASVLRATVSAGIALVVMAGGRATDALRGLVFAFVLLLLFSPEMLVDPGFQLSFGATVGIVVWGEPLSQRILRLLGRESRAAKAVAVGLGTTIAAQLAVAPLLAWHFGRIPGVGAVANVVAIPLGGMVMVGGMATLSAASVVPFLDWAPAMMRLPLDVILGAAHFFARLPSASIAVSTAAAVAITAALAAFVARPGRTRTALFSLFVVCGGVAGGQSVAGGVTCPSAAVYALDVGQGTAVALVSGEHTVLVDAGPADGDAAGKLKVAGIDELDAIIVTHPHIDHALGAIDVLDSLGVGHVYGPVTLGWGGGRDVIDKARERGVAVDMLSAGDSLDLGGISIDVLWPEPGPAPSFDEDLVDPYSLVLRAELGGTSVLLPGDIRAEQQSELVQATVDVPLLVAVHHGSKNLDREFVDAVSPRMTLVTVGAPNPYGLPAPEAVRTYARHGPVFRTDQDGRVSVCLEAGRAEVVTEK
jgi:competence protein ComEC